MVVDNTEESYRSSIIEKQSNTSSKTSKSDKLSQGSGRKGEAGLSFEFIKEQFIVKEKTPWEQDLDLQTERILNILDKAIGKLRMVTALPKLIEDNGKLLSEYMSPTDTKYIVRICNKYVFMKKGSRPSSGRFSNLEQYILPFISSRKEKLDPQITQILDTLWNAKPLREACNQCYEFVNENSMKLIYYMELLKEAIKSKISISAEEERAREIELKRAYHDNIAAKAEIEKLDVLLEKQREELGGQLAVKEEMIDQYQKKLKIIKDKFNEAIKQRINDSEKKMVQETIESEARQEELSANAKAAVQKYESLLEQHLNEEKALRAKRYKVETQLATWLAKYDQDIGERNAEFEEIQAEYDEEKAAFDELQEKFDEQNEQYVVLMGEKEEEEQRIFEEKAYMFLIQRSARLIQRCWRAYKIRKSKRRKKKKGGEKKKGKKKDKAAKKTKVVVEEEAPVELPPEELFEEKTTDDDMLMLGLQPKKEDEVVEEAAKEKEPEGETGVEGEGGEEKGKKGKGKDKKDKGKKKKKLPKGEKPKSKKDVHLTKEADAVELLEKAFGGDTLGGLDETTAFTKDEVKVEL